MGRPPGFYEWDYSWASHPRANRNYSYLHRLSARRSTWRSSCHDCHFLAVLHRGGRYLTLLRPVTDFALFQQDHWRRAVFLCGVTRGSHCPLCLECPLGFVSSIACQWRSCCPAPESGHSLGGCDRNSNLGGLRSLMPSLSRPLKLEAPSSGYLRLQPLQNGKPFLSRSFKTSFPFLAAPCSLKSLAAVSFT